MRFGRKSFGAQQVTDSLPDPVSSVGDVEGHVTTQASVEVAAQLLGDRWSTLSADKQTDIQAAAAEQRQFMDVHGIAGFHRCTRKWDHQEPLIPTAADIRAETELLRSVLPSVPPA